MARVLLVDDDDEFLELLGEWLSIRGYAVRMLADGRLAPAAAREFDPDVVILDGLLRGTTGPAVAKQLKAAGHRGIIYLSGLCPSQLPGGDPVIQKPIDLDVLHHTIQHVMA